MLLIVAGVALVMALAPRAATPPEAHAARPVSVVAARATTFRTTRRYVGTLRPWIEASVGPQLISAYVDTVLVRPGVLVKRGDVLATLDCRSAGASHQQVAAEARAIAQGQQAAVHESARIDSLLDGGFVAPNEAEQKAAASEAEGARLAAQQANVVSAQLEVSDCVLRAPFDAEVATRTVDPGAFVRPGTPIVSIVDRRTVRMTFDVPEVDFDTVAPATPVSVHVTATDAPIAGRRGRRWPSADPETRTIHVEVDLDDPARAIPVNTTGEVALEVGPSMDATAIPIGAASVAGSKATTFVVEGGVARKKTFTVEGQRGGDLVVDADMKAGSLVVTEGRATLVDGDRVDAHETTSASPEGGSVLGGNP